MTRKEAIDYINAATDNRERELRKLRTHAIMYGRQLQNASNLFLPPDSHVEVSSREEAIKLLEQLKKGFKTL